MQQHPKTLLQFNNLHYSISGKTILDGISNSILAGEKVALIGDNGSGKSTLLKILIAEFTPEQGEVIITPNYAYLPQLPERQTNTLLVFEYLQIKHPDWWEVLAIYEVHFRHELKPDVSLKSLSGGELTKLNLSLCLAKNPDLLILDEPTNHLDHSSLNQLETILTQLNLTVLVVSHHQEFLINVPTDIWELKNGGLITHKGHYQDYLEYKEQLKMNHELRYNSVRKQLNKKLLSSQDERIKYAKKQTKLKRQSKMDDRSQAKMIRNQVKRKLQSNLGTKKIKRDIEIERLKKEVSTLKPNLKKTLTLRYLYQEKKGLLISLFDVELRLPDGSVILEEINLKIMHQDRIAIMGDNGSGKTTLSKQLRYKNNQFLNGKIKYGASYSTAYLDQNYNNVLRHETVLENVLNSSKRKINYRKGRKLLSGMNFQADMINKPASGLSGGELARLALILTAVAEVDLLILDEPANNLDLNTKERLSEQIKDFPGTLVVISHDKQFLGSIGIEKHFQIRNRKIYKKRSEAFS